MDLCRQSNVSVFNMLSRLVITSLPRSKGLLISWLQSPPVVIFEPPQNKVCHYFHCFPSICHEVIGPDAMILVFWMMNFKPTFSTLLFHFHRKALYFSFAFCHKCGVIWISEVIDISPCNFLLQVSYLFTSVTNPWGQRSCLVICLPLPQHDFQ